MRKHWSVLLAGGVLAGSALGLPGTAVAATATSPGGPTVTGWPTGCEYEKHRHGARARCAKSNGGHYRANVTCARMDGGGTVYREAVKWVSGGEWSAVFCPPMTQYLSAGITTKST
ncbi:hypothetical protein E0L36_02075 [Streptomyces sp. AJS327]|uniref:hypothetical protein n=1 Tax=Streptomyces sp. AJS327 TaxID=2545265 RepID=UPI0015DDA5FB|nr:hypothetical protein [Streptomyces sp. AJS327]MBA0049732.1 hypothetical protein [Streptomyces sp. AJS327]